MKCLICGIDTKYIRTNTFIKNHVIPVHNQTPKKYYDTYLRKDGEGICVVCGKETTFINATKGYSEYHRECSSKDENHKRKVTETWKNKTDVDRIKITTKIKNSKRKKYGDENYRNSARIKKTCVNRYGVVSPFHSSVIQNKVKNTVIEKYGIDNISKLTEIKEKKAFTMFNNYGVYCSSSIPKNSKMLNDRRNNRLFDMLKSQNKTFINTRVKNYFSNVIYDIIGNCPKCNRNFEIMYYTMVFRIDKNQDICTNCTPINSFEHLTSIAEKGVLNFIETHYKGKIEINNRNLIAPLELDIYLPELKLAFEYNGVYWHNEVNKSNDYHLNKTDLCEREGIQLIHIYEDDWMYKQDIVKSRIMNHIGHSERIYARKCIIKEVDYKTSRDFLIDNHLQGSSISKIRCGLYYNGVLVSLMTFGGLRKNLGQTSKDDYYELLRFCNKLNTTVVGGASKLFKYFSRTYNPIRVISYADRSWSKGVLYEKLGFKLMHKTKPNYYYVVNGIRENRFKYRKSELIKLGYDKNKTEREIMLERKIYRIYDSGSLKYMIL